MVVFGCSWAELKPSPKCTMTLTMAHSQALAPVWAAQEAGGYMGSQVVTAP